MCRTHRNHKLCGSRVVGYSLWRQPPRTASGTFTVPKNCIASSAVQFFWSKQFIRRALLPNGEFFAEPESETIKWPKEYGKPYRKRPGRCPYQDSSAFWPTCGTEVLPSSFIRIRKSLVPVQNSMGRPRRRLAENLRADTAERGGTGSEYREMLLEIRKAERR